MADNPIHPIYCSDCTAPLGHVAQLNDRFYLARSGLLMLIGTCRCLVCGRVLHWHGDRCTIEDVRRMNGRAGTPVVVDG